MYRHFKLEEDPLKERQLHTERRAAERPSAIKSELKRREFETMWSKSKAKKLHQKAPFRSPSAKKGKLLLVAERSRLNFYNILGQFSLTHQEFIHQKECIKKLLFPKI